MQGGFTVAYVLDRIENDILVLVSDEGNSITLQACEVKAPYAEGDVMQRCGDGLWRACAVETACRRQRIQAMLDRLGLK